jgi:hypothetical protein
MEPSETTHFGYQKVAAGEKARKVAGCVRFRRRPSMI